MTAALALALIFSRLASVIGVRVFLGDGGGAGAEGGADPRGEGETGGAGGGDVAALFRARDAEDDDGFLVMGHGVGRC